MPSQIKVIEQARRLRHQRIDDFRESIKKGLVTETIEKLRSYLSNENARMYDKSLRQKFERVTGRAYRTRFT